MPEGPTVRKFSSLVCAFVGRSVLKVGGSTKQINPKDLMGQHFITCQVHGKNLYLLFGFEKPKAENKLLEEEGGTQSYPSGNHEETQEETQETSSAPSKSPRDPEVAEDDRVSRWLRFHFGLYGSVRANEFSRAKQGNKRGDWRDPTPRLILHFDSGGFLVFYNCRMAWCSSPFSEPSCDILNPDFDCEKALRALSMPRPVCVTLMDQRHFSGVGNIIKNEILFLAQIHPLSFGSLLPLERLRSLLDHAINFTSDWLRSKMQGKGLHYHVYQKEHCAKGHNLLKEAIGPPCGLKRLTWYCPECQPPLKSEDAV
ncbi:endonuclease 8-like 2 [Spea bombifrons]|uniref:endonuclease 8-like 2 n=1 Tax=Spea bombifrons TaxID=233779 RepID=UPI002349A50A|nr:endonuclease 8-like 2 [Spea bombifrons]